MRRLYDKIIRLFDVQTFMKGLNYNSSFIKLIKTNDSYLKDCFFEVKSERTNEIYDVKVAVDPEEEEIIDWHCDCPQYDKTGGCKHITAAILKYSDEIFDDISNYDSNEYNLSISKNIINSFYKPKNAQIKKKLNLEITLMNYGYYNPEIIVKLRIGENKLYTLTNKYNKFFEAYKTNSSYRMTTNFIYDPNLYYFEEKDKNIIDFLLKYCGDNYYGLELDGRNLDSFMELLKNKNFYKEKEGLFAGVKYENPFAISLTKSEEYYELKFNNFNEFKVLLEGYSYVYDNVNLYRLPNEVAKLYNLMGKNDIDTLMFEKEDLEKFTNGILPFVKDKVILDESVSDIVISSKPECKLYFDFYYNMIECKVKLLYGEKEINILENIPEIVRDSDYEGNILQKLWGCGFAPDKVKQHFLLEDIELIGEFLEHGLDSFSEKYEVFTSQKIKDTNIVKNTSARANFSIGKDNIMSYTFKVDGVNSDELCDLLTSMQAKKKYYRLKSGVILNLEANEELHDLGDLTKDMGFSDSQITAGNGEIPKYRAIYLDSLKRSRYNKVISTNNLFNDLIGKFKAYKDNEIILSQKELSILRDYQVTGVKWLYNIYKCGFGGILADEMGLGKSIQLIYLIKLIVKENSKAKVLIVAPTSLIYNWKKEFDKFAPELKYKVFAENRQQRLNDLENIADTNVLITTYGLVRNDVDKYKDISFDLIAIDEAQNIKNANAQMTKTIKGLKSNVKIALTGTPLENSVMELWSIFDFIMPGYLANNKKFQSLYNIKDTDEESMHKLDTLNMQITSFILRRKKKDVVKELPDKIENNIYIDLGPTQKKLYMAEVEKTKREMDEIMMAEGFPKARFKILQLLTKLRQICIDPSIVFENYKGGRAKIEELLRLVKEIKENGHKMLIFTTYKTALDIVLKEFSNNDISAYYIDGSVPSKKRMELVEKFNNDDTDAFIITLKAGGTGLNLTSATVVIHLDLWWNPQVENQATDRAHRIGQKNTVEVIRLVTNGTIEERILELQDKKRKLADALIEGDMRSENNFSNLTEKDIEMLLSMDNMLSD